MANIITTILFSYLQILVYDLLLFLVCLIPVGLLCTKRKATFAILKRNFVGYFSNPTGYVFLCLFVCLCSFGAFWPPEFFNDNLANLAQLSRWFPLIMLVFVPAITMAVWSEERREGTDELLLTLPASDLDIVLGKFIAAVGVFSVALMISQAVCFWVLAQLSYAVVENQVLLELDVSLLFANFLGYWLIGVSMLALGMVASFLTSNLTVAFVLGLVINVPLVIISYATDIIPTQGWTRTIARWSVGEHFDAFSRGVVSSKSLIYFCLLAVFGLYLCLILIGRRHWYGGRDGSSKLGHYIVRAASILVFAISFTMLLGRFDARHDMSEGKISTLSPETRTLIKDLNPDYAIRIDAFIGSEIPDKYVETKTNLVNMLKELARTNSKIDLNIYDNLELFSDKAQDAEVQFGIVPTEVAVRRGGRMEPEQVLLGAAFRCGLQREIVEFFDYGIPVEYELARKIATVAEVERKKLGIVNTEAQVNGGGHFGQQIPQQRFVEELEGQYDVEAVDLSSPISNPLKFDVLMVVQPSSLAPEAFNNLLKAIRAGIPTAIFEDPLPEALGYVTPTGQPKRPAGGNPMMGMQQRPQPKANIQGLWDVLGIKAPGSENRMSPTGPLFQPDVVWQRGYNPYPRLERQQGFVEQWIFIAPTGFSEEDAVTSGLQQVFFPAPGSIQENTDVDNDLKFVPLIQTSESSGLISYQNYSQNRRNQMGLLREQGPTTGQKTLAARITGKLDEPASMSVAQADDENADGKDEEQKEVELDEKSKKKQEERKEKGIDVIYVADIDLIISQFFAMRARPDNEFFQWKLENATFLLNVIDSLAGNHEFVQIRKRKPKYTTLMAVEKLIADARDEQEASRKEKQKEVDEAKAERDKEARKLVEEYTKKVRELEAAITNGEGDEREIDEKRRQLEAYQALVENQTVIQQRQLQVNTEKQQQELNKEVKRIQREQDKKIQNWQFKVKLSAVLIPPIPLILIGLGVFVWRRYREREGVSSQRMK